MFRKLVVALLAACAFAQAVAALDRVQFQVPGADNELRQVLSAASLVRAARQEGRTTPRDLLAAALADYGRLLDVLYSHAHYGPVISIRIDGREAADISVFDVPDSISTITIAIDPGPQFRFSRAEIAPLAPKTRLPPEFAVGEPANSGVLREAVDAAVQRWQQVGHAKATVAGQKLVADHNRSTLAADIRLDPGPKLRFGRLLQQSESAVRPGRVRRIAALPSGTVYSPEDVERTEARLRRTGAFSSVSLSEAETPNPDGTLDMELTLVDEKPRRLGFGAELSSLDGLGVSAYWMHRNLFGGAERLRFDGEVSNLVRDLTGVDVVASGRLDIPAALGRDTTAFFTVEAERLDERAYLTRSAAVGVGVGRIFSDSLDAEVAVNVRYTETRDALGRRNFTLLTVPSEVNWDRRDDPLDAERGFYLGSVATPFFGLDSSVSGMRLTFDARVYRKLAALNGSVAALRVQGGSLLGAGVAAVPPDFLFLSGGGGTVRGQPYQSLGVGSGAALTGGRSFVGGSAEMRLRANDSIGIVGFVDAGFVGAHAVPTSGSWHAGAGAGLRYDTGIGPIRLDVALPVAGSTGKRSGLAALQLYLGIGQAF